MQLVYKQSDLNEVCCRFSKFPYIIIDTEFIRDTTYWPNLCLIQMAYGDISETKDVVIIDVLAKELDLTPFFSLLADERIIKVLHSMRQDIDAFMSLGQPVPTNLFDTQIAAIFCGMKEQIGYDSLVMEMLGVKIDKSLQITDWYQRPLTEQQLSYAMNDVTYLNDVYLLLLERLHSMQRSSWLQEEMLYLNRADIYENSAERIFKNLSRKLKKPLHASVCKELVHWREGVVQERNIPRSYLLSDEDICVVSSFVSVSEDALRNKLASYRKVMQMHLYDEFFNVVQRGMNNVEAHNENKTSQLPRISKNDEVMVDIVKVLLHAVAADYDICASVIARTGEIKTMVQCICDNRSLYDEEIRCMRGWRWNIFGTYAVKLMQGDIAIYVRDSKVCIHDIL